MSDLTEYDLPANWTWTTIGSVSHVEKSHIVPKDHPNTEFNYLSIENIESGTGNLVNFKPTNGKNIGSSKLKFTTDDILYSKLRPYLNKVHIPIFSGISATDLIPIRPENGVRREYLAYYLRTQKIVEHLNSIVHGIQLPRVSVDDLLSTNLPLAPSNEQKRIVSKIEELFKESKSAREALDKIPQIMKKFRQSVLASAFKGELVPQDPNDEPASLLLEKIRREKGLQSKTYFGMSELVLEKNNQNNPSGWEFVPLSQIAEINPKMQNGKINSELRVSFVPMKCVEELSGQIDLSNSRKYEEVKRGYTYFANGDILFAKITPCMENGKIVIAKNLKNGIGFGSTEFHVVRLFNKNMPREFYFWYLMQDKFRNNARHNMKGTAGQLRVPVSFIENSIVPVPPVNEQKRIVAKIEELFSFATQIEKSVEEAKKRVDKIDQAILAKAFRGELVPQDPNDEPASVLLERIMKEKEIKQTVQRKPRKSR